MYTSQGAGFSHTVYAIPIRSFVLAVLQTMNLNDNYSILAHDCKFPGYMNRWVQEL